MESSSIEDAGSESAGKLLPLNTRQRLASCAGVVLDPPDLAPIEAESTRKLHSSRYKGVVPQPNGRWGAQIYEKHHRVWLGTFNDEAEAARSYDVAAQRFRGRDAITNFTPLSESSDDVADLIFLNSHSKAEIVDMLRKHTYYDELMHRKGNKNVTVGGVVASSSSNRNISERLFHKAVTPSDVGKLNRLVIPKQQAEKHFPLEQMNKGMLLCFEDGSGKVWRFRYSYWNSSQSYVLTKGWSRFVKEKSLKAGDVVSFQRRGAAEKEQLFIDVLPLQPVARAVDVIRLFGVNICKLPIGKGRDEEEDGAGDFVVGWSEKRGRTMDMVSSPTQMLKQRCTRAL